MRTKSSNKLLAAAVLCSLLAASPVWAAQTVTYDSNISKVDNPYSKIEVKTTEDFAVGIEASDADSGNLRVYMSTDSVINVSAAPTETDYEADAFGLRNGHASSTGTTLTVQGPVNLTVSATGSESIGGVCQEFCVNFFRNLYHTSTLIYSYDHL